MTTPQLIYLCLVGMYGILFLSFLRLFVWKHYSDKHYWRKRPNLSLEVLQGLAANTGRQLPRFSIFVPARNEADVIEKTIDHLSRLDYPSDAYEVLVATDEKEAIAARDEREGLISALITHLTGQAPWPQDETARVNTLLIGLLARLSRDEVDVAERQAGQYLSVREALTLPADRQREIIREIALDLRSTDGRGHQARSTQAIARALASLPGHVVAAAEAERLYPVFLGLAIPVALAAAHLHKEGDQRQMARLVSRAARARQPVTQRVLITLTETISQRVLHRLTVLRHSGDLPRVVREVCAECFPTTQEIVERKRREYARRPDTPVIKHVVVPNDFDGNLHGVCTGQTVPSTKGRALNYAFTHANPGSEMFAYYDAESRPHGKVLQYVAYKRLTEGTACRLLQGPVFQVRNFFKMGPFCKIVSLYQSISHDWYLPVLMRSLPFVGGTNLFIDPRLLEHMGGYDHHCLTEDLELGIRAWMQEDAWPEYLPYASSEQTPPTFRAFFRQRLRWGAGYLQVYEKVRAEAAYPEAKRRPMLKELLWKGQIQWALYQAVALVPPLVGFLYWDGMVDASVLPFHWRFLFNSFSLVYLGFTFYTAFRYWQHLDTVSSPNRWLVRLGGFAQLLALPVSAFFLPVPYSSALVLRSLGRAPKAWVKTPRSKE